MQGVVPEDIYVDNVLVKCHLYTMLRMLNESWR
jgi:hypothetical protein